MQQETEVVIKRRGGVGQMVLGIILGSLIGGTIALLAAPRPGHETRRMLADKGIELKDRATGMASDVRDRASDVAGQARERVQMAISSVRGGSPAENISEVTRLERDVNVLERDIDKTYDL
ncbi:MAG: YtxH domain-containing protein [Anaerolineaceae bacterium]|nr:YtxH domain-containing protein [Anaerolineaceae bacterium]